ncbi:hypothetical protein FACS189437_07010 [Bacteroidia bacterium]|nr:hypothetical protein FACS189437_07010 [Bacteroidia bacterium]
MNGNLVVKQAGELYVGQNRLDLTGNYSGEFGSRVYLTANGFINISGTAIDETEIIPDFPNGWDGSRIDFVKASKVGSINDAFQMPELETNGYLVQLKYETQDNSLIWYIEKTEINPCLPLIVQLRNHTLLVNNNNATNGGYRFVYYKWYKNGILLKEASHADNGGSYYTGGADLDENADYTVEVMDGTGKSFVSCPYRFVPLSSPVNVSVYPNPVPRNAKAYIQAETQDLTLLNDAVVDIYDLVGQYAGKAQINGQTLTSLDLPAKSGVYFLKFKAKDFIQTIKLVVK